MGKITNNEFKTLYTLIERISSECSKRFKSKTTLHLSITEFNSLSLFFTIKYEGNLHTVERNLHRMEIASANYEIYDNLMNYIDGICEELKRKLEKGEGRIDELRKLLLELPDYREKRFCGDFDE